MRYLVRFIVALSWLVLGLGKAMAGQAAPLQVAVIGNSPPMSYRDEQGRLTGFNVEFARALCAAMKLRCELRSMPLGEVVDQVASGTVDVAVVSLLMTPERRQKVLFSKPYYRSLSAWVARPGFKPGAAPFAVAVVHGSAQARYAEAQGWSRVEVRAHTELASAVASGQADSVLLPMLTALAFVKDREVARLGLTYTLLSEPQLAGDVGIAIAPRRPELRERVDAAIDQLKRDGSFDRINSQFLPFKLQ